MIAGTPRTFCIWRAAADGNLYGLVEDDSALSYVSLTIDADTPTFTPTFTETPFPTETPTSTQSDFKPEDTPTSLPGRHLYQIYMRLMIHAINRTKSRQMVRSTSIHSTATTIQIG